MNKKNKCSVCGGKVRFKNRYILGIGYPVRDSISSSFAYLGETPVDNSPKVALVCPSELSLITPKYRLVLERIK